MNGVWFGGSLVAVAGNFYQVIMGNGSLDRLQHGRSSDEVGY
jgi:hypothetical protein